MTETVTVPRELLRRVLDDADATAAGIADVAKMQRHLRGLNATKTIRERICKLRKAAGLEEVYD